MLYFGQFFTAVACGLLRFSKHTILFRLAAADSISNAANAAPLVRCRFVLVCWIYGTVSCILGRQARLPLVADAADQQVP